MSEDHALWCVYVLAGKNAQGYIYKVYKEIYTILGQRFKQNKPGIKNVYSIRFDENMREIYAWSRPLDKFVPPIVGWFTRAFGFSEK